MAAKRHKCPEQEEYENPDRYLGSYADMITILLVLFIVLFAFGQIDLAKFQKFKEGFGRSGASPPAEQALLEGGSSVFQINVIDDPISDPVAGEQNGQNHQSPENEGGAGRGSAINGRAQLEKTQRELADALAGVGLSAEVKFRIENRGLVITVVTDKVLFNSGAATLTGEGNTIIETLAGTLGGIDNLLSVEGHTDDRPIATGRFPDNWELSGARASAVLRTLVEDFGFAPGRLSTAGYADTKPVATNETDAGQQANRRVEIVVKNITEQPQPDFGEGA